jgi:hypothetical protein
MTARPEPLPYELAWPNALRSVSLVMRPKRAGPARHAGVLLDGTFGQRVVDRGPDGKLRLNSVAAFRGTQTMTVEATLTAFDAVQAARSRLVRSWNTPSEWRYGALDQNCEHLARHVVLNQRESPQALAWIVGSLVTLAAVGFSVAAVRSAKATA